MECLLFVLLNLLSSRGRVVVSLETIIVKGVRMSIWGCDKRSAELWWNMFCSAFLGAQVRLMRADKTPNVGAHFEPGGLRLSKIGLKPAGFMGSRFTGGDAFTGRIKHPRAQRITRILENGTAVSRGCIIPVEIGNTRRNCSIFFSTTQKKRPLTALSANGSFLIMNTMGFTDLTVQEPFYFGHLFNRYQQSY